MDPLTVVWCVLVVGALVSGVAFVGVLVVRRDAELVVAIIGIAGFGFSAYSLVTLASVYGRLDAVLYGFAFMAAALAGGYALASSLLERLATRPPRARTDEPGRSTPITTATITLSCVEPEDYEPAATAGMLSELAAEELVEPSLGALPFLYFGQKARYRAIGGSSPAWAELSVLAEALESPLASQGVDAVIPAACAGPRQLAAQVQRAIDRGCQTIVVALVAVAESLHVARARDELDALLALHPAVRVVFLQPLGDSDRIVRALAERVLRAVGDSPSAGGAVLVGHGQPDLRAERNPGFDEVETAFLNRIRMELVDSGMAENCVRVAWAEWGDPDITSTARHLAALGCRRVVVVPAVFPFECIGTRLDMEIAVRQARVDENVSIVTLPAWRDDDVIVTELVERVRAALKPA